MKGAVDDQQQAVSLANGADDAPAAKDTSNGGSSNGKKKAVSKGLSIGPAEVLLALVVLIVGYFGMQKQTADAMLAQCAQQHERGEYEQALSLCSDALITYHTINEYTKALGLWQDGLLWADVAQTTDNMGVVTMNLGDNESSLRYLDAALAMRMAKLGPDSLDVAATKDNIGLVYRQMNDFEKAKAYHNEVGLPRLPFSLTPLPVR